VDEERWTGQRKMGRGKGEKGKDERTFRGGKDFLKLEGK